MTAEPSSPRRRHILSSYNPEDRRPTPRHDDQDAILTEPPPPKERSPLEADAATAQSESTERRSSKFRFKSKRRSHRTSRHRERDYNDGHHEDGDRDDGEGEDQDRSEDRHRRHRRHRHHHRHRRRRSRTRSPTPPNPHEPPPLSPETAFRESLFDAMADDEGAAYWEGVYGQPIHVYSNAKANPQGGALEQMDDDEYAAYVRQKMWEKTHQGLLEERARREEKRKAQDEKAREARRLTKEMEESLRRGEERRRRRGWKSKWEAYAQAWSGWDGEVDNMSWPVHSERREDITSENVRDFFVNGLDPLEIGEKEFVAKLKEERVRWHPDKIQQRLGSNFDESVRRDVTAVFQIIDKLWSDTRSKK
ncbi:uncharacterized protein JN550_000276 [Neoarthrinium moseri]|uniref:uncharacterized protein n=1 Tax=Neoarthrinium moseri TaxID=1658444 RepID=UPI001FDD50EA|nr:uncharacterized protein JN550_000276 [Neoarthrinium moseri]KAI1878094.1 hypothetical protein JN550_000276 [Neoarthrinium moseri]